MSKTLCSINAAPAVTFKGVTHSSCLCPKSSLRRRLKAQVTQGGSLPAIPAINCSFLGSPFDVGMPLQPQPRALEKN